MCRAHRSTHAGESEKGRRLVNMTSIKRLLLATDFSEWARGGATLHRSACICSKKGQRARLYCRRHCGLNGTVIAQPLLARIEREGFYEKRDVALTRRNGPRPAYHRLPGLLVSVRLSLR